MQVSPKPGGRLVKWASALRKHTLAPSPFSVNCYRMFCRVRRGCWAVRWPKGHLCLDQRPVNFLLEVLKEEPPASWCPWSWLEEEGAKTKWKLWKLTDLDSSAISWDWQTRSHAHDFQELLNLRQQARASVSSDNWCGWWGWGRQCRKTKTFKFHLFSQSKF